MKEKNVFGAAYQSKFDTLNREHSWLLGFASLFKGKPLFPTKQLHPGPAYQESICTQGFGGGRGKLILLTAALDPHPPPHPYTQNDKGCKNFQVGVLSLGVVYVHLYVTWYSIALAHFLMARLWLIFTTHLWQTAFSVKGWTRRITSSSVLLSFQLLFMTSTTVYSRATKAWYRIRENQLMRN